MIAGNGPSLNQVDWDSFKGVDIFASNYGHLHEGLRDHMTYLSVVNPWVVSQDQESFDRFGGWLFLPFYLSYWIGAKNRHLLLDTHFGYQGAKGPSDRFSTRSSVSYFNMQLALCLGYRKVILVGFDHNYQQPERAVEGDLLKCEVGDPNHFSEEYFRGKIWQAADTRRMEFAYSLAKDDFRRHQVEIVNCGLDSKLEVFEKQPLATALDARATKRLDPESEVKPEMSGGGRSARGFDFMHSVENMTGERKWALLFFVTALALCCAIVYWPKFLLAIFAAVVLTSIGTSITLLHKRNLLAESERQLDLLFNSRSSYPQSGQVSKAENDLRTSTND